MFTKLKFLRAIAVMYDSMNDSNSVDPGLSDVVLTELRSLLRQQAQLPQLYENIAILGCGYVGSALADFWQTQGHFVTGTTTRPERVALLSRLLSQVVVMTGDDAHGLTSLCKGQNTVVVSVSPSGSRLASESDYATTYLSTARNMVEALRHAPDVQQVVYLSSCSVYGDRQGSWVDESTPLDPVDRRGQVIHQAEQIISLANSPTRKVCILRLGGIYGRGRELVRMLGGLAGTSLPGKGDRIVNWIHLDDIVGAIEFARLSQLEGIYNLVDDSQMSIKEQAELICCNYGLPNVQWDGGHPIQRRPSVRISNHKIKATGYNLTHPQLLV